MSGVAPVILAADDGDLLFKVIGALIVGLIWVASQLVGWLNSKKDKSLPPSRPRPTPYRTPAEMPPPPMQRRPQQAPPVLKRPPAMKPPRKPKQRPVPVPVPVPVPAPEPVAKASYGSQGAAATVQAAAAQAYGGPPKREDVLPRRQALDALLRPRNLRKAFVVTELLGPPVALRDGQDSK